MWRYPWRWYPWRCVCNTLVTLYNPKVSESSPSHNIHCVLFTERGRPTWSGESAQRNDTLLVHSFCSCCSCCRKPLPWRFISYKTWIGWNSRRSARRLTTTAQTAWTTASLNPLIRKRPPSTGSSKRATKASKRNLPCLFPAGLAFHGGYF